MDSPIELVRRFCAAWSEDKGAAELAAFFTEDAVHHNIPLEPITAANGPVVLTERVDVFRLPGRSFELPVMGTFEITDGKISAWRDYFDMNQFTTRMG